MKRKQMAAAVLVIITSVGLTGFGPNTLLEQGLAKADKTWVSAADRRSPAPEQAVSDAQMVLAAADRASAGICLREAGEELTTSFFACTVDNVRTDAALTETKRVADGQQLVAVDIAVRNIYPGAAAIPVGNYDFTLVWEQGQASAEKVFAEGMYPDHTLLAAGETLNGTLVFAIPQEVTDFQIVHDELWDDGFVGGSYAFLCSL